MLLPLFRLIKNLLSNLFDRLMIAIAPASFRLVILPLCMTPISLKFRLFSSALSIFFASKFTLVFSSLGVFSLPVSL